MEDYIFEPESRYSSTKENTSEVEELYTVSGDEEYIDIKGYPRIDKDASKIYAKRVRRQNGSVKYLVRLSAYNKLYNPVSIYGQENQKNFLERVCRSDNKFTEVNLKVFELYLNFLKTRNTAYLHNAERESE